ncbi:IucA/IucC family C-terminal-domain containing protein [Niallia sp. Krafla_26]|uniref:IucA/IucC family C-terminal-domain containing protein n=1 Tax=Niallia sp. Krafla_26 TaxID=3064703 RepID=UPI003D17C36C
MFEVITEDEIQQLKPFRFTTKEDFSHLSIPVIDLLDDRTLLNYLEKIGVRIGSPSLKVTASIFIKRYAFLAAIYLYSISSWNKKIDISFTHIKLQTDEAANGWIPTFYFDHTKLEWARDERYEWREEAIQAFFAKHVDPLVVQLSRLTKLSKLVLWENIAIYIFWLYESILLKSDSEEVRERAKKDFHYLVKEAPGNLFGDYDENPIKRYFVPKRYIGHLKEEVRVRETCCFSYLLESSPKRCKTCPHICKIKNETPI